MNDAREMAVVWAIEQFPNVGFCGASINLQKCHNPFLEQYHMVASHKEFCSIYSRNEWSMSELPHSLFERACDTLCDVQAVQFENECSRWTKTDVFYISVMSESM